MSAKIEDVDSSLQREVKRTRGDVEKITKDIKSVQTKIEEAEISRMKGTASFQEDIASLKTKSAEFKNFSNEFASLKTDCDKNSKDLKSLCNKMDEVKKDCTDLKSENISSRGKIDKLLLLGKDIDQLKKDKSEDKLTSFEKGMSSLRADYEKLNKDIKGLSCNKDSSKMLGEGR